MHFVLLAEHSPQTCPTANAEVRALVLETGPSIPKVAELTGVKIVAGPFVNREHVSVVIVDTERVADLDRFLAESRLSQWNSVRVLPSQTLEDAMKEFDNQPALF